jgi:hypothetical protein
MNEDAQKFIEETERIAEKARYILDINILKFYSHETGRFHCTCPLSYPNATEFVRHVIRSHYRWARRPDVVAVFFGAMEP